MSDSHLRLWAIQYYPTAFGLPAAMPYPALCGYLMVSTYLRPSRQRALPSIARQFHGIPLGKSQGFLHHRKCKEYPSQINPTYFLNPVQIIRKSTSGGALEGPGGLRGPLGTPSGTREAPLFRFGGLLHYFATQIGSKWSPNWEQKSIKITK